MGEIVKYEGPSRKRGPKPGSKRRKTLLKERAMLASGLSPLEFALTIMRDEDAPFEDRWEACKAALPYCHPRLNVNHNTEDNEKRSHEEWLDMLAALDDADAS